MNDPASIFRRSSAIRFGDVPTGKAVDFYRRLNDQVPALCRSLPRSAQTEALMFLMGYVGIGVGEPLEFFKNYYPPAWSVLYWLVESLPGRGTVSGEEIDAVLGGQAMAMLLHSLDDHLVDGDVPVSHVTLLIRGQAWHRMNECINRFCAGVPGGIDIARDFIGDYYTGITEKKAPGSLDMYCELFRKQMATWVIMPVMTARKIGDEGFVSALRSAYESFGIAWRLLDDIQDLEADIESGDRSAVYTCLDEGGRALWESLTVKKGGAFIKTTGKICSIIQTGSILGRIAEQIVTELRRAADLSDRIGLGGLAEEFRALATPVNEWLK
jgi:hypothetical protein